MRKKKDRFKWLNSFSINALRKLYKNDNAYPGQLDFNTNNYIYHIANPKSSEVLDFIAYNYDNQGYKWRLSFEDLVILCAVWSLKDEAESSTMEQVVYEGNIKGAWYKVPIQRLYKIITHYRWSDLTNNSKYQWLLKISGWCKRMSLKGSYQYRDRVTHKIVKYTDDGTGILLGGYKLKGTRGDWDSCNLWFHTDDSSPIHYIITSGRQVTIPDDMTNFPTKVQSQRLAEYYIAFQVKCTSSDKAKMHRIIRLLTLRKACGGKVNKEWLCRYMDHLKEKGYIGSWSYSQNAHKSRVIKFTRPEEVKQNEKSRHD